MNGMKIFSVDSGSTLVEVVIASMILALAGTVLVGGFLASKTVQQKTSSKAEFLADFTEAVQEVTQRPYADCRNGNPYPTPQPLNPSITVSVLNPSGAWVLCDASSNFNQVQLIRVFKNYKSQLVSQELVKTP